MSTNFVAVLEEQAKDSPSCHVCGAVMTGMGTCDQLKIPHQYMGGISFARCQNWKLKLWRCLSCHANSGCS